MATSGSKDGTADDSTDPWDSISKAVKAIPKDVVEQETYYVVEILDSGDYYGEVKLDHNFISQIQIVGDGTRAQGIYFDEKTDNDSLFNVTIVGYEEGLSFRGGSKAAGDGHVMRNAILRNVGTALFLEKALGNTFASLDYNDLHPLDGGDVASIEGAAFTSLTDWQTESGLDEHSMSLDPLFADDAAAPGNGSARQKPG